MSNQNGRLFLGYDCEYHLDFSYMGALRAYHQGLCNYSLKDSLLIFSIKDSLINKNLIINDLNCSKLTEIKPNDYQFKVIVLPNKGICLIGPILKDYKKLNRQRFIKAFLNWPWKWSFKKQHWYDPRWRELKITGQHSSKPKANFNKKF